MVKRVVRVGQFSSSGGKKKNLLHIVCFFASLFLSFQLSRFWEKSDLFEKKRERERALSHSNEFFSGEREKKKVSESCAETTYPNYLLASKALHHRSHPMVQLVNATRNPPANLEWA